MAAKSQLTAEDKVKIKGKFRPQATEVLKKVKASELQARKLYKDLQEKMEEYFNSDNFSSAVGEKILTADNALEAMRLLHVASNAIQFLNGLYRIEIYPTALDLKVGAKTVYDILRTQIVNDEEVVEKITTISGRENLTDEICQDIDASYTTLKTTVDQIETLGYLIKEQTYEMNRMDTMIRSVDQLRQAEMFAGKNDNFDTDFDSEVDNAFKETKADDGEDFEEFDDLEDFD